MSALKFLIKKFISTIFEEKLLTISKYFDPRKANFASFQDSNWSKLLTTFQNIFHSNQTLQAHPKYFCSEIILQGLKNEPIIDKQYEKFAKFWI